MQKQKVIMKKSLALFLLLKGHKLIECVPNKFKQNNNYMVYKFIETPQLIEDMVAFNKK